MIEKIRNTKFEARNKFENRMIECSKRVHSVFVILILNLIFVSDFDIRISDLC